MKKYLLLISVLALSSQDHAATNNEYILASIPSGVAMAPLIHAGMHVHFPTFVAKSPRIAAALSIPLGITVMAKTLIPSEVNIEYTTNSILGGWALAPLVYAGMHVHLPTFVAKNPRIAAVLSIPLAVMGTFEGMKIFEFISTKTIDKNLRKNN